jgi:hypothetical protein
LFFAFVSPFSCSFSSVQPEPHGDDHMHRREDNKRDVGVVVPPVGGGFVQKPESQATNDTELADAIAGEQGKSQDEQSCPTAPAANPLDVAFAFEPFGHGVLLRFDYWMIVRGRILPYLRDKTDVFVLNLH